MKKTKIQVINGPNLNLLGKREPHIYGSVTLQDLQTMLMNDARKFNIEIDFFQSNYEGEIIEKIHGYFESTFDGIIINPGGLTHTSISLRDALLSTGVPFIEVHISNIYAREPFRHYSYISDKAVGVISGLGIIGYRFALIAILQYIQKTPVHNFYFQLPDQI